MSDDDAPQPEPKPQSQQVSINVDDEMKFGQYANFLVVSHSPHEFTLDFCQLMPGQQGVRAEVVSRVRIAPTMAGKIIQALNTNMTGYEEKYGQIKAIG